MLVIAASPWPAALDPPLAAFVAAVVAVALTDVYPMNVVRRLSPADSAHNPVVR